MFAVSAYSGRLCKLLGRSPSPGKLCGNPASSWCAFAGVFESPGLHLHYPKLLSSGGPWWDPWASCRCVGQSSPAWWLGGNRRGAGVWCGYALAEGPTGWKKSSATPCPHTREAALVGPVVLCRKGGRRLSDPPVCRGVPTAAGGPGLSPLRKRGQFYKGDLSECLMSCWSGHKTLKYRKWNPSLGFMTVRHNDMSSFLFGGSVLINNVHLSYIWKKLSVSECCTLYREPSNFEHCKKYIIIILLIIITGHKLCSSTMIFIY